MWSETTSRRAASAGAQDVYVCAAPERAYDSLENRVLASALVWVRDAGRGVDSVSAQAYDDDTLRRARFNGLRAIRFLDHRTLSAVKREKPTARALKRTRSGTRRTTYRSALEMLGRAADPLDAADIIPFCDRRTRAQHGVVMGLVGRLEERGAAVDPFRAFEGTLFSGPIRYNHPRRLGRWGADHGIWLGDVLVDVPEQVRDRNRERVEYSLSARAGGTPTVAVLEDADLDRAINLAIERADVDQAA